MASASILIRWAQAEHVPSLVIASYRLTIATLVLAPVAIHQQAWKDYATLGWHKVRLIVLSGLLLGMHFAAWITSLEHTSVVSSVVLVTTTPLWLGIAAPYFTGDRTPGLMWLGLLIATIGGIIIGLAGAPDAWRLVALGDLLALAGALFGAAYLLIGRSLRVSLPFVSYVWAVYGTAALFLILWAIINGYTLFGYSAKAVLWLIALGLIPQLIGHSAANYAIRYLPPTLVGLSILGEPVGAALLAGILLGEWPSAVQLLGASLILAGIAAGLLAGRGITDSSSSGSLA